ncbi:hypothetical protein [Nonomuraea angiospora]|uniref:hypothetical protein n=1 Tax=Nonomuraea angiospora TaxID=46172 RepID=UPI001CEF4248|nr:hypothetical protein [Nonomuraea angiospora]
MKRGRKPIQCPVSVEELGRRYASNSIRGLAESLGVAPVTAKRWLRAAGIELHPVVKRGPEPMRCPVSVEELGRRYASTTVRGLAASLGVSSSTAKRWLREAGIGNRPGGRGGKERIDMAVLIARYEGGEGLMSLGRAYGRDKVTVRRWLRDAGVELRGPGRPRKRAASGSDRGQTG